MDEFRGGLKPLRETIELDLLDRKIIYLLSINCRFSLNFIAKTLNTRVNIIRYRIEILIKKKILGGYFSFIDIRKFGLKSFLLMIKLRNFKNYKDITLKLSELKEIYIIQKSGGQWDVRIYIHVKSNMEYSQAISKILEIIHNDFLDYRVFENIDDDYFNLGFILDKKDYPRLDFKNRLNSSAFYRELSQPDSDYRPDEIDIRLLKEIQFNGRESIIDLANKMNLAKTSITLRLSNMTKSKHIKYFVPFFSYDALGYQWFKIMLKVKDNYEKKGIAFIRETGKVATLLRLVGDYNLQLSVFVKNIHELYDLLNDIRNALDENLITYEIIMIFEQLKFQIDFDNLL